MIEAPVSEKSWKGLEMEKETRFALELFFIYVLFITLLRLLDHGEITGGIVDEMVFGFAKYYRSSTSNQYFMFLLYNFISRFRGAPLLYVAAPIAILVYAIVTKANENSRRFAVCFSTFTLINYLIPPIATLFSNLIAGFIVSRMGMMGLPLFTLFLRVSWLRFVGSWPEMAYRVCVTIFMSAYIFKLRRSFINLAKFKAHAETNGRALLPWPAVVLITAAIFIAPLFAR
jgi:hypothetical protein